MLSAPVNQLGEQATYFGEFQLNLSTILDHQAPRDVNYYCSGAATWRLWEFINNLWLGLFPSVAIVSLARSRV